MKNSDKAFIQAYNTQAAVDSKSQIIVAADLTNQAPDVTHLPDMVKQIELNLNRKPKKLLADAGYFSEKNVTFLERRRIDAYIPPDKQKHNAPIEPAPRGRIPYLVYPVGTECNGNSGPYEDVSLCAQKRNCRTGLRPGKDSARYTSVSA